MLELPQGRITERRRGGTGILALLAADLSGSGADAYIRTERLPVEEHPHVGYIVFRNGLPLLALHQVNDLNHATEAMLEIENDASEMDCLLTVHRNIDVDLLVQTFPSAMLDIELESDSEGWWRAKSKSSRSWTRVDMSLERAQTPSSAEVLNSSVEARLRRLSGGLTEELLPGYAHLISSADPTYAFKLAALLEELRHPTLVISRRPIDSIAEHHGLNRESCLWLTEQVMPDASTIEPQLESIYMVIKSHLDLNERSVLVLDGFEFLHAIHGFDSALDFLRKLADIATTSDDLTLIPLDLNVFEKRQQALIKRELDFLDVELLEKWLASPEDLEGHKFHLPDSEEQDWDDRLEAKSVEKVKAEEESLQGGISLAELVEAAPVIQQVSHTDVNRVDMNSIMQNIEIETVDEEQLAGVIQFRPSDGSTDEAAASNKELGSNHKGPRKPVVVKRSGKKDKRAPKSSPHSSGSSGLDQANRVLDSREKEPPESKKINKQDHSRTYRQYYDAHRHKGA